MHNSDVWRLWLALNSSGSMEPAFFRGDLLFLTNDVSDPIRVRLPLLLYTAVTQCSVLHRVVNEFANTSVVRMCTWIPSETSHFYIRDSWVSNYQLVVRSFSRNSCQQQQIGYRSHAIGTGILDTPWIICRDHVHPWISMYHHLGVIPSKIKILNFWKSHIQYTQRLKLLTMRLPVSLCISPIWLICFLAP